jgi:hypothetical protein
MEGNPKHCITDAGIWNVIEEITQKQMEDILFWSKVSSLFQISSVKY